MVIFTAMFIPVFVSAILWFKYRLKTKWWEFLIPFAASFIFASIMHFSTSFLYAQKEEYWTGWIKEVNYFEEWNEKVYYTEKVEDGTEKYKDSDGKTRTRKKYKYVKKSRIDTHPAYWTAEESNGRSYNIDSSTYKELSRRWGHEKFIDMKRKHYSKDGDRYVSYFNNNDKDIEVATTSHLYQNKVILSRSVFNFKETTEEEKKEFGLLDYPSISGYWDAPSVLGNAVPGFDKADRRLSIFNAKYGASCQVRVWLLVFKDKTLETASLQQNYWKNGNMNEFVICVGVDRENKVKWGKVFSWTDSSSLIVEARDVVSEQTGKTVNLDSIVSWVENKVPQQWVRKSFKKDFKYININPPWWAIILTFVFTAILNFLICFWIVSNEFFDDVSREFRND